MQFTPDQLSQIEKARALDERRVALQFTVKQRNDWQQAVEQELAGKDENIAHFRKIKSAAEQVGFFGDIRRAILLSRRPLGEIAAEIGADPRLLSDFRAGESELPPAALNSLVAALGLRLMLEIPR